MKPLIHIILSGVFFCLKAHAQILGGDSTSAGIYYNNFPDLNISGSNTAFLDVDNDGSYDLKLKSTGYNGLGWGDNYEGVYILNPILEIGVTLPNLGVDTMIRNSWIDRNKNWQGGSNYFLFTHEHHQLGNTGMQYSYFGLYWGSTDRFMGIRINHPNDTLYGWVQVANSASVVKSSAIQMSTTSIEAINKESEIQVYPNPCSERLYIEDESATGIGGVSILTIDGKSIHLNYNGKTWDVSELAEGLYFLEMQTQQGIVRKKVVVKR